MHKVQHKPINIQVRDPIQKEQKGLESVVVWRTGLSGVPPDSVRCTRTVQVSTSHSQENTGALHYNSLNCPVCQRATAIQRATVDSDGEQWNTVRGRSQSNEVRGAPDCPVWHWTVWCRKRTKPQRSTELRTLIVGWRGGAPDSLQCLSGGAPDCLVRPSPAASPTATLVVEGYKYPPNHHNSKHPRFLNITFNTRALATIQKIKASPSPQFTSNS
jgi:hypothetical protein